MGTDAKIKVLVADNLNTTGYKEILTADKFRLIKKTGLTNQELLKYYNDFDALIINSKRKINRIYLSRCNHKIICTASRGIEHIDSDYAKKKGIDIVNSLNGNYIAAAEHTIGMIISISRNFKYSYDLIKKNKFSDYNFERSNLCGKFIGIIGMGKIGSKVAELARAFGMHIIANDNNPMVAKKDSKFRYYNLQYLLTNSDIITVHIPLDKKNYNFIDSEKLRKMKKNAIFINTSRGGVVDEMALLRKLERNLEFRAGIDVFQNEPEINGKFKLLENALLTNHIAGKTKESVKYIFKEILLQVKNRFEKY